MPDPIFTPIDELPEPPRYGQIKADFVRVANRFFGALPNYQRQQNALAEVMNNLANATAESAGTVNGVVEQVATLKGQIDSTAEQVATDSASAAEAAGESVEAKEQAQALYGDLEAINSAKTTAQNAAVSAAEDSGLAEQARVGAVAARNEALAALADKLAESDVVDSLESMAANKPLSANQGRVVKGLIDTINGVLASHDTALAGKLAPVDVLDSLNSTVTDRPLSANQGRVLKGLIDTINGVLNSDDTTLDELQEIVEYIKLNRADLDALSISSIAGLATALAGKAAAEHTHDDRYYTKGEVDAQPKGDPWTLSADSVALSYDAGAIIGLTEGVGGDTRTTTYTYTDGVMTGSSVEFRGLIRIETFNYTDGQLDGVSVVVQEAV